MRCLVQFSCMVVCHENWRFFVGFFVFILSALLLWWHFQCRHFKSTWTHIYTHTHSHTLIDSQTHSVAYTKWQHFVMDFALEWTKYITYASLKSSSWDNIRAVCTAAQCYQNGQRNRTHRIPKYRHCRSQRTSEKRGEETTTLWRCRIVPMTLCLWHVVLHLGKWFTFRKRACYLCVEFIESIDSRLRCKKN